MTMTKAQIDAQIFADVSNGMTKAAAAEKYGTSARSIGRAIERHEKSGGKAPAKAAVKPAKATSKKSGKKAKSTAKAAPKRSDVAKAAPYKPEEKTQVASTVLEALEKGDKVEYINTSSSVVLTLNGESEIVEETHPNFKAIQIAIVSGDFKQAFALMNIRKSIENFTQGAITIKGDKLFYGTIEIRSTIAQRILELMRQGDDGFKTLVSFFEKLMENPSRNSVEQLWGFISHNDIEIDSEGYIIGWKRVRNNGNGLVDSRTSKVPNNIGNIVSMPRWMVDADKNVTCSQGLHVGAWDYVRSFSGDTTIKVRVHPRDVVSVPTDYNDQKMRSCQYEVVGVVDSNRKIIDVTNLKGLATEVVVVGSAGELISRKPRV
ncbi:RIIB lysis inhibitor [Erwinia phage vB_Eam-MM7]|uniref:RIIB protein n=1 Tax=Erwinia phage vB_Eam-MM7 TaxID=1051674 RepID=G0YPS1_9CAUD|nr:RIIB lysis inhibitor [Erwinia phage vB_Eam-MM7]AEJ81348.1 rIIB protein [Erwinia phage vB_Eam-MM7]UNA01062.1 putative membrane integrity protector RIIB [Erwinia phage Hena2]